MKCQNQLKDPFEIVCHFKPTICRIRNVEWRMRIVDLLHNTYCIRTSRTQPNIDHFLSSVLPSFLLSTYFMFIFSSLHPVFFPSPFFILLYHSFLPFPLIPSLLPSSFLSFFFLYSPCLFVPIHILASPPNTNFH